MIPQFRQNKITGDSIAWGRGCWDKEVGCYVFLTDQSYQIRVTDSYLIENGIVEDDLLDCIMQIEETYGSPSEYRTALGLFKNSGYSNLGLTVESRSCPAVTCVFTPTSTEDNIVDAYFEWYYNPSHPSVIDLQRYLNRFSDMTGARTTNVTPSPVMPGYMEAQEFMHLNPKFTAEEKDRFLRGVWQHQTTKDKGFKVRLERELLPEWVKFLEEQNLNEASSVAGKKLLDVLTKHKFEPVDADAVDTKHGSTIYYLYFPEKFSSSDASNLKKFFDNKMPKNPDTDGEWNVKDLGIQKQAFDSTNRLPIKVRKFEISSPSKRH